jgi:EAL domain-containing protein (putative c-di-GMP-specific phosphodiesterase class I)
MCRNLGIPVVGEGVETRQQLAVLRSGDCAEVQGYLVGKPMPAEQAAALVRRDSRRHDPSDIAPPAPREFELAL